jgi:hypothetical protein
MLGGTVLDRVSSLNDLGVIMDEKMTFSEHNLPPYPGTMFCYILDMENSI